MRNCIGFLNISNILTESYMLVIFDILKMFLSTDDESDLQTVKNTLAARKEYYPLTLCIIKPLELCLKRNNTNLNKKYFLETNGTAQKTHMPLTVYSQIVTFLLNNLTNH